MEVYNIDISCEHNISRSVKVYDYRINSNVVIIEADKLNPTDYAEYIYNVLELSNDYKVFLDLTNIYGFNKSNFYEWHILVENMKLIKERFTSIDKINWNNPLMKKSNDIMKLYLNEKIKRIRNI